MKIPSIRTVATLAFAVFALSWASTAEAQSPADAKRTIRAQRAFFKEPGMMETKVRYMKGMLMVTGWVPSETQVTKANELGGKLKGVKEVRNRLVVREPEVSSAACDQILAKIDEDIENDNELQKSRRKLEITCEGNNVTIKGKLKDYTLVGSLINDVRKVGGIRTLNFDKLKW